MRPIVPLLLAWVAASVAPNAGAITSSDLCPGAPNPCVLACTSARVNVDTTLDFGQCDLLLAARAQLQVRSGVVVHILARSVHLASAAQIDGSGDARNPGATIFIQTTGGMTVDAGAAVNLSGSNGGLLFVRTGGDVELAGPLTSTALAAAGRGGGVSVVAGGAITVDAPIDTTGGTGDAGDIDLDAGVAATVNARLTLEGSSPGGGGGDLSVNASSGSVVIAAPVSTAGARGTVNTGGGNGGDVSLSAGGDLRLTPAGTVTTTGGAPDGDGGRVDASAGGGVVQQGTMDASTVGSGTGGPISIAAGGALNTSVLTATGGSGGDVDLAAGAAATVGGPVDVSSTGGDGDGGGITVRGNPVLVTSPLTANGDTRRDSAGSVGIMGCGITIAAGAELDSKGILGVNILQADGAMTVLGNLNATPSGTNRLEYRAQRPTVTSRSINPAATVVQNAALLLCPGSVTTTTTSTSTTTVTTSSRVPTTQPTVTTTTTTESTITPTTAVGGTSSTTITTTSTTVTTSSTRVSSTTSTTTPTGCEPPTCDDDDLCTMDSCVAGTCEHVPVGDIDAVKCRLDGLVAVVSATPVGRTTVAVRERLLSKIDAIRRVVERARPPGRHRTGLLARADRRLAALVKFVDRAVALHRLETKVATTIDTLAGQARAEIAALRI